MSRLAPAIVRFLEREDGPTAVEYAVILALNVILCLVAIASVGTNSNKVYKSVKNSFANYGS